MAPRETDTMFMQNFGVTNKEYFGMLWHFLQWSICLWHVNILSSLAYKCGLYQIHKLNS